MNNYVITPKSVCLKDILGKDYSLSSSQYVSLVLPNGNFKYVKDFLQRKLKRTDLGIEVGSLSYIDKSTRYFIRTKALQPFSYIPDFSKECKLPILPQDFVNMHLKKGDVLISKDSNIGEVVILDKDYPDCMLSGAIYKLPIKEDWKYYLLAFIKHPIFREQLDFLVPKGATIRHAKTLFLDCKIPLPNHNDSATIQYISDLTKAIINKQTLIRQRHAEIMRLIDEELKNNQKPNTFTYHLPKFNEIEDIGRLDTGLYTEDYKCIEFLLKNYLYQTKTLKELQYKALRGPNLAISVIGTTRYSDKALSSKYYRLIQPMDITPYGTVASERYFGNKNNIQLLKQGDILFGAEGNIGKSYVLIDMSQKTVTNFHGVSITNSHAQIWEKCFVGCFLMWLKGHNFYECYSVGGQGGSYGIEKIESTVIPQFPDNKQKEIAKLYHNPIEYPTEQVTLDNFLAEDDAFNTEAGIYELDKSAKHLQELLNKAIDDIVNDREVEIKW